MNKIVIDKEIKEVNISDGITFINNVLSIDKDVTIDIKISNIKDKFTIKVSNSKVIINILGDNTSNEIGYILQNSELLVQKLVTNNSDTISINLNSKHSKATYRYSNINNSSNEMKIDVYHNAPNTDSVVINHGLNLGHDSLMFDVNGYIPKKSIDCSCNQDSKIINLKSNKSLIRPNLIIDNNQIEANHSAYIGSFKEDEVFYLMSRGISEKEAFDLLIKAYLIGEFQLEKNEDYLEKIKSIGGETYE